MNTERRAAKRPSVTIMTPHIIPSREYFRE
jgi:hypothetical protein